MCRPDSWEICSHVSETDVSTAPRPLLLTDGRPAAEAWSLHPGERHLNHGSFGAVPVVAQREQQRLRAEMDRSPVLWFATLPGRVAAARTAVAGFLRVTPEDLALVPNASGGASVVYANVPLRSGAEIVVTDHGYGAVTMGAERLARRWGATVRTAHVPLDATPERPDAAMVAELNEATGLIVIDHITSATARFGCRSRGSPRPPRQRGIATLVDGAHVPGLYDDPLDGVDCDFWIGNLHKFACAPRGTAVLLVASGSCAGSSIPLIDSWGAADPIPRPFRHPGHARPHELPGRADLVRLHRGHLGLGARPYRT